MITKYWWEYHTLCSYSEPQDFLFAILISIVSIPLDIILLPFELMALILYKINKNRRK